MKNLAPALALSLSACGGMSLEEAQRERIISPVSFIEISEAAKSYKKNCEQSIRPTNDVAVEMEIKAIENDLRLVGFSVHGEIGEDDLAGLRKNIDELVTLNAAHLEATPEFLEKAKASQMDARGQLPKIESRAKKSLPEDCSFEFGWTCAPNTDVHPGATIYTGLDCRGSSIWQSTVKQNI